VFCAPCSRGKVSLPLLGYGGAARLRVCALCFAGGAGAAAAQEARERRAADPQVPPCKAMKDPGTAALG
jgi:hypothetical protein